MFQCTTYVKYTLLKGNTDMAWKKGITRKYQNDNWMDWSYDVHI